MKKIIAFLLLAVLMLSLCACDNTNPDVTEPPTTDDSSTSEPTGTEPPTDDGKVDYTVSVQDENGNPIANVAVQLCDKSCIPGMTNENGIAEYHLPEGNYHASILDMPAGYAYSGEETEFYFAEGETSLVIVLKAAE